MIKKAIRLKDLRKVFCYPPGHQWEDSHKILCGWGTSDYPYRNLGTVKILEKKEACKEFNRRIKNKEYRLEGESYLEFQARVNRS